MNQEILNILKPLIADIKTNALSNNDLKKILKEIVHEEKEIQENEKEEIINFLYTESLNSRIK